MEGVSSVLTSSNGIAIAIICVLTIFVLLLMGKLGLFSYKGKGLCVGRTENEVRAILLKQKEYLLQYCSYLTQNIISDMAKKDINISYINTDYVVEKVVDEWLGWLLVNNIREDESYINLKIQQSRLIMLKAIGRVNPGLLQDEEFVNYFNTLCEKTTKDIIKGMLSVYRMEKREK